MVHKVNAMITFETVTAGDRMSINHPNKPIKNELLQLTNPIKNNMSINFLSLLSNMFQPTWLSLGNRKHIHDAGGGLIAKLSAIKRN